MRFEAPRIQFHLKPPRTSIRMRFREPPPSRLHLRITRRTPAWALSNRHATSPLQFAEPLSHAEVRPTGFEKYARRFTAEGGIQFSYEDAERTLPVILGKLTLLLVACVMTYYAGHRWSPIPGFWWNAFLHVCLTIGYAIYFLRDLMVEKSIEIRPDCMVLDGADVFWKENMPMGWPSFVPDEAGNFVLFGVYGSRWVEYLTIRRHDENDRAPEVLAAQLSAAMTYLWELPQKGV